MRHKFYILIVFILLFSTNSSASYIEHYLKIIPDGRTSAMGGAGTTGKGVTVFQNPSKTAASDTYTFLLSHISWIAKSSLNYCEANFKLPQKYGFIGLSFYSMNADGIERRKIDPSDPLKILPASGEASAGSMTSGLSYANVIDENFFYGVKINMLRTKYDIYSDNTMFLDAGVMQKFSDNFSIGFAAKNLGGKMSFTGVINEKVYNEYRFGTSFDFPEINTLINLDAVKYSGGDAFFAGGIEYSLFKIFKLRAGWQNNYESEMRFSFGAGLMIGFSQIDFAYQDLKDLEQTFRISLFMNPKKKYGKKKSNNNISELEKNININEKSKEPAINFIPVAPENNKLKTIFLPNRENSDDGYFSAANFISDFSVHNQEADILSELSQNEAFKRNLKELSYKKFVEAVIVDNSENYSEIKMKWNSFENSEPDKFVTYNSNFNERIIIDYSNNEIIIEKLLDKNGEKEPDKIKNEMQKFYNSKLPPTLAEDLKNQIDKTKIADSGNIFEQLKIRIVSGASKPAVRIIIPLEKNSIEQRKNKFGNIINKMSESFGVNPALVDAIVRIESSYNQYAFGKAGEIGLMQITPATAGAAVTREIFGNVKFVSDELYDPEINIFYGTAYLNIIKNKYLKKYSDLNDFKKLLFTITAYNAGLKYVNKFSEKYDVNSLSDDSFKNLLFSNIPQTTSNYITKTLEIMKSH